MSEPVTNRREYLYAEQLAQHCAWSVDTINHFMDSGVFKRGVHWFQPTGRGGRRMLKWSAIVDFVEGKKALPSPKKRQPLNVEEAETALSRLHARA